MASLFHVDIRSLKGVGEKRAGLFQKLGAPTVGALLRLYPRAYEDWSPVDSIACAPFDTPCAIRAAVVRAPAEHRIRQGLTLYKLRVTDGASDMDITLFNNKFGAQQLVSGEEFIFYGRVSGTLLRRQMSSPAFARAEGCGRIRPIYPLTEGLTNRMVENAVRQALLMLPDQPRDPLPPSLREEAGLCGLAFAIHEIHFPSSDEALAQARKRLAFEELFTLALGMFLLKRRSRHETGLSIQRDVSEDFLSLLPFAPTGAQRRAVKEAMADMRSDRPMNRLLQGDVGSGKTAVAAALCYCAAKNSMQCALMAPTEILAEQHYRTLRRLFAGTGLRCELLTGSQPAAHKRDCLERLARGEIDVLAGTHALISDSVVFSRLGLVIADEQHRFGVAQRAALAGKGERPHLLVMSATPIPRTLALMIYGDLDVSVLDELPPGRQEIDTFLIDGAKRERAFAFIRRHLDAGRQAYIVCPLVEEAEEPSPLKSAQSYFFQLQKGAFHGYRIGLLHGRMKAKEKEAVMSAFSAGELSLLVATTVIEVGVDVPNAVVMAVENAERFGLSQLHQLRGRVGRGKEKSSCILISDTKSPDTLRRLQVMTQTGDGFRIADEDLKLRGPGDFFGSRQHGLPPLRVADLQADLGLLKQAQSAAQELLRGDPQLSAPLHRGLALEVNRLFCFMGEQALN